MSTGPVIERARRAAVLLVALAVVVLAGRATGSLADGGPTRIRSGEATEHALVAFARTGAPTVASAVAPVDLPRAGLAWSAAAAGWGVCLLLARAATPRADRLRRWRARLQGAPPPLVVLPTHP